MGQDWRGEGQVREEAQEERWPWDPFLSREVWLEARRHSEKLLGMEKAVMMSHDKRISLELPGREP